MSLEFKKSPLNEVIIGMQFDGSVLSINNIMKIIDIFKMEYPDVSEHPPLLSIVESYNNPRRERMLTTYASRKHIIHKNKNRIIQVQPDRLLFNWRKEDSGSNYPRFDTIYSDFKTIFEKITAELGLQVDTKINQFEFIYIDHIYLESFSLDSYALSHVMNVFNQISNIKDLNLEYSIPKEELGGVLITSIKSAKSKIDNRKLFVLENTCRGFIPSENMDKWFSRAHTILLNNFINIITDEAKEIWQFEE